MALPNFRSSARETDFDRAQRMWRTTMRHDLKKPELRGLAVAGGLSALLILGVTVSAHAATTDPSVIAFSQRFEKEHFVLDYAFLPSNGYAVVYGADKDGKPIREPLGIAELKAGDHRGVRIKLNSTPEKGAKLWVSLYSDKDGKPGFDRKGDVSFWQGDLPAENQVTVQ
jgi:hypothetical protein